MNQNEIVISRNFSCDKRRLFNMWVMPEYIEQWWGPRGFTTRVEDFEFKPGGRWKYIMTDDYGEEIPLSGKFELVDPPETIVCGDEWEDDPPTLNGMTVTVEFLDRDSGQTEIEVTIAHKTKEDKEIHKRMGVVDGWLSSFDRLDELLH